MTNKNIRFWKQDGEWRAAIAGPDPFGAFNFPDRGPDWWKRFGLIGRGNSMQAAQNDLERWQACANIVG